MARRARAAHLRERVEGRVEALGRADENDPERVPPDAVAERGPGSRRQAHGRFLFWRRRGAAAGLHPAADQVELDTPESRHHACWYGRRTRDVPLDLGA